MTDLMSNFPKYGKLEWSGISTTVRAEIKSLVTATLIADTGIEEITVQNGQTGGLRNFCRKNAKHGCAAVLTMSTLV